MTNIRTYAFFIALAMLTGIAVGMLFTPGSWYAALEKPLFNPPNWIFAPVWTALYLMIGIAGGMVWRWDPQSGAVRAWFLQFILNTAWTPVFFGLHLLVPALGIILVLWLTIAYFIGATRREVGTASWLFVPYFAWVSFATLLNAALVALN